MIPPNGIPCMGCGKKLCSGDPSIDSMPDSCPHCGLIYKDTVWKQPSEPEKQYEYRIYNDINLNSEPIFLIQRREQGSHHIGNWKTYALKVFHDKEEATPILKHLQGN